MEEFAKYLIGHLVLDFSGDVDMEQINTLLLEDGSPQAKSLRSRLIAEGGCDDFLLVLADCLKDSIHKGINESTINDQVDFYLDA